MALPALVWNKGIAALCDHRVPDEFPGGTYRRNPKLAGGNLRRDRPADFMDARDLPMPIMAGDVVWVRLAWLGSFIAQALPRIDVDFVLATGDSVQSVPTGREIAAFAPAIVEHPRVLHWFAQNCARGGGRISHLPLGIDFHTLAERPNWGEPVTLPVDQERTLLAIARSLPPVEQRVPRVYLDFVSTASYGGRGAIVATLSQNPLAVLQRERLPRNVMFRRRGDYAFVVSPHGTGLDCHRTWEALALGHIVLVPASPLDPLYEGLPVIPIRDWTRISERDLTEWADQYGPMTRDNPRVTSGWWVERMRLCALFPATRRVL